MWIVKPGENSNRGNGICIYDSLEEIEEHIVKFQERKSTFIIQSYIDKPFLYNRRKFDFRCYVLLVKLVCFVL